MENVLPCVPHLSNPPSSPQSREEMSVQSRACSGMEEEIKMVKESFSSLPRFDGVISIIGAYQANWPSDKSHSHGVCHISVVALCSGMTGLV